jgi:ferric-dicitrate binding protein FerR (iron transport regulator)
MKSRISVVFLLAAFWTGCNNSGKATKTTGRNGEIFYRSGAAGRTAWQLPDGTELLMDSFSVVGLPAGFNKLNRDIFLAGTVLFTVHASGIRPVVVHTRALVITVSDSSTASFKVEGRPKSPGEEVDLFAGNLRVAKSYHSETDNEPVTLSAGEMVMINTDIDLMEKEKND